MYSYDLRDMLTKTSNSHFSESLLFLMVNRPLRPKSSVTGSCISSGGTKLIASKVQK